MLSAWKSQRPSIVRNAEPSMPYVTGISFYLSKKAQTPRHSCEQRHQPRIGRSVSWPTSVKNSSTLVSDPSFTN